MMDDLEQSRCKLLHRINKFESQRRLYESPEESEQLRDLKEKYNAIINRIEEANPSPLGDPLEQLPAEIWQDIIRECCINWREKSSSHSRNFDRLLTFTLVSRKWSEIILSTPILWSEIVIYSKMADLDAKVVTWLTLSGDLPLHINLEIPIPLGSESLQILREQGNRIRTIRLMGITGQRSEEQLQLIDRSLASLGDLLSLEVFDCRPFGSYLDLNINLSHIKRIQMLRGVNLSQSNLSIESMQNLRSIYTQQPFKTLLQSLSTFPNLKTVSCNDIQRFHVVTDQLPSQSIKRSDSPINKNPLPWLHLSLLKRYIGEFSPILDRVAPTLLELQVLVAWGDLEHFLSTCGQLRQLRKLTMELPSNTLGTSLSPLNNIPTTNIRSFNVSLGGHSRYRYNAPYNNDELRNNIQRVFEVLPSFGPKVTHLSITTRVLSTPSLLFAQKTPHLRELEITGRDGGNFQLFEILLPEVEKVHLSCIDPSISLISCPKAIRLDIIGIDYFDLKSERWRNIQHLEISGGDLDWVDWGHTSLPYLQKLVLHTAGKFFLSLALHPTSFPRLTHVRTGEVPEWDILFIMLERRNFLTEKSTSPIEVIGLPCLPHINILHPLCDRLRGVFSDRPSNLALSFQGFASIYVDRGINGCDLCQTSFLRCDKPPSQMFAYDAATQITAPHLPDYPSTPEEILSTYSTRKKEWNQFAWASGTVREYSCSSSSIYPTEITGYTSIGLSGSLVSSF